MSSTLPSAPAKRLRRIGTPQATHQSQRKHSRPQYLHHQSRINRNKVQASQQKNKYSTHRKHQYRSSPLQSQQTRIRQRHHQLQKRMIPLRSAAIGPHDDTIRTTPTQTPQPTRYTSTPTQSRHQLQTSSISALTTVVNQLHL